ncbi:MAG: SAM-dependent methyltransferase [Alphaproteobacteria bacterium]|nr:SAM-dependent methyltransferase [Alphaproteobacteria bacterium]
MNIALTHRTGGYYNREQVIGKDGDFTTAPEISGFYGAIVGLWCLHVWQQLGSPKHWNIVELGPGRGTLMHDVLHQLKRKECFPTVWLLETSKTLRQQQKECLASYPQKKFWLTPREGHELVTQENRAEPTSWHGDNPTVFIANEFFDCFPVEQVSCVRDDDQMWQWFQRCVARENNKFVWDTRPISAEKAKTLLCASMRTTIEQEKERHLSSRFSVECRPYDALWIQALGEWVTKHSGAIFICDYGYEAQNPKKANDTIQAIRGGAKASPLDHPGTADITAHVDFGALQRELAEYVDSTVCSQGQFLLDLGIIELLQMKSIATTPHQAADWAQGVHRLVAPEQMGWIFKTLTAISPSKKP